MTSETLKIYSDGGARGNPGPAAAAFIVTSGGKAVFTKTKFLGNSTNNLAEYTGVLMALKWLTKKPEREQKRVNLYLDSELVVKQLKGNYKVKNDGLRRLFEMIKEIEKIAAIKIIYNFIPRDKNKLADHLVNKTLDRHVVLK